MARRITAPESHGNKTQHLRTYCKCKYVIVRSRFIDWEMEAQSSKRESEGLRQLMNYRNDEQSDLTCTNRARNFCDTRLQRGTHWRSVWTSTEHGLLDVVGVALPPKGSSGAIKSFGS